LCDFRARLVSEIAEAFAAQGERGQIDCIAARVTLMTSPSCSIVANAHRTAPVTS
jgi:hypothetical protein